MDGNGRWAQRRHLPRVAGHRRGVDAVRAAVAAAGRAGVEYLTLFAFSSENWRRPADEVSVLMRLFVTALQKEVGKLDENGVRLRVVGALEAFDAPLREAIHAAEQRTAANHRLTLTICANYGGRWDVVQAMRGLLAADPGCAAAPERLTEASLAPHLALAYAPDPDLLIRTGGESRVSNFLLWQIAYSEIYVTPTLWPDFDAAQMEAALAWFAGRERRFGMTSEQVRAPAPAPRTAA
jgi:undecaprenyl diphosphate synthase